MIRKTIGAVAVAAFMVAVLGTAGAAGAADAPKWVAALYVEAQKIVGLRWVPVPGATNYKIFRSLAAGKDAQEIGATATPQYLDSAVEAGTTYYYTLKTVAGAEISPASEEKSVITPGAKKVVVLPPTIDSASLEVDSQFGKDSYKVGILWHGTGPAIAYNLYRSTESGKLGDMLASSQDTRYIDVNIEVGKTYFYSVTALDETFQETKPSPGKSVEIKARDKAAEVQAAAAVKKKVYPTLVPIPVRKGEKIRLPTPPYDILSRKDGTFVLAAARLYTLDADGASLEDITPEGIPYVMNIGLGLDGEILATVLNEHRFVIIDGNKVRSVEVPDADRTLKTKDGREVVPSNTMLNDVIQNVDGKYWVTDNTNCRIVIFEENGKYLTTAAHGTDDEIVLNVASIAHDSKGTVFVAGTGDNAVYIYDKDGNLTGSFGETGNIAGTFGRLAGIYVDKDDNLWISDLFNATVQKFNNKGDFLGAISSADGKGGFGVATPNNIALVGNKGFVTQGIDMSLMPFTILP